ncbi:MAG TPA: IS66 family insertion sequence element accessory protein TnpB [Chitinophagaceae bacterium]|nr:IS66 family insertion sequence element accessory protein TnpB [Chitinophagaceae bacterium]
MLHLSQIQLYYLYRENTDMRKGFDSLAGIVLNQLDKETTCGEVFIFLLHPGWRQVPGKQGGDGYGLSSTGQI